MFSSFWCTSIAYLALWIKLKQVFCGILRCCKLIVILKSLQCCWFRVFASKTGISFFGLMKQILSLLSLTYKSFIWKKNLGQILFPPFLTSSQQVYITKDIIRKKFLAWQHASPFRGNKLSSLPAKPWNINWDSECVWKGDFEG